MIVEIFDVEHGACALVTTSNGKRVMIDAGHNATTGWRPGDALRRAGVGFLERLYVTNFDEDHVSGYPNLANNINLGALFRNPSVAPATIRHLKSVDGMGIGIERLIWTMENYFTGGPVPPYQDFGDVTFSTYWNQYGLFPPYFDDENNLSLVVFVICGIHKFIFPGDMERDGWLALWQNPTFVAELAGVTIFVASHHGRENGYCEEVMRLCPNINLVVISDKAKGHQSQETTDRYRSHTRGIIYNGDSRHVLTTRRDGNMSFTMPAQGMGTVTLALAAAA
jgi:beta-lactamase superfamily II metal-dependent hydrolase